MEIICFNLVLKMSKRIHFYFCQFYVDVVVVAVCSIRNYIGILSVSQHVLNMC